MLLLQRFVCKVSASCHEKVTAVIPCAQQGACHSDDSRRSGRATTTNIALILYKSALLGAGAIWRARGPSARETQSATCMCTLAGSRHVASPEPWQLQRNLVRALTPGTPPSATQQRLQPGWASQPGVYQTQRVRLPYARRTEAALQLAGTAETWQLPCADSRFVQPSNRQNLSGRSKRRGVRSLPPPLDGAGALCGADVRFVSVKDRTKCVAVLRKLERFTFQCHLWLFSDRLHTKRRRSQQCGTALGAAWPDARVTGVVHVC